METTLILTKDNYFDVGNEHEIVLSNSALAYINPNQGGSFKRFKQFLAGESERKESMQLEKGKMFHRYMENKDAFLVEDDNKPSQTICDIIDKIYIWILKEEIPFETLASHEAKISEAALLENYGQKWNPETIINKIKEQGESYFQYLVRSSGKVMISKAVKEALTNMIATVEASPDRDVLIDRPVTQNMTIHEAYLMGERYFFAKEFPILFELEGIKCKALIDHLFIDFVKKEIQIRDLKTTSFAVSKFMGVAHFVITPEGELHQEIRNGSFQSFHYYRQFAFYLLAIQHAIEVIGKHSDYKFSFVVDVIETEPPYEMASYNVPPAWIKAGMAEIQGCMQLVKKYIELNGNNA